MCNTLQQVGKCPMAWQRVQVRNTLLATPLCPLSLAATQMALRTGGPTGGASMCWVHCTLLATSDGCPPLLMGTLRWMAPRMAPLVARGWCWIDLVQNKTWLSTSGTPVARHSGWHQNQYCHRQATHLPACAPSTVPSWCSFGRGIDGASELPAATQWPENPAPSSCSLAVGWSILWQLLQGAVLWVQPTS